MADEPSEENKTQTPPKGQSNGSAQKQDAKKQEKKQDAKSGNKSPKQHPAEALAQNSDAGAVSPVQPIETVRTKPEEGNEEAETVTTLNKPNIQEDGEGAPVEAAKDPAGNQKPRSIDPLENNCWNCANHGRTTKLGKDGICPECEFDKNQLYNLNLESEKARQRALAESQY